MDIFEIPIDEEECIKRAKSHLDFGCFGEATKVITLFNLHKKFDLVELCMQLVENN